METTANSHTDGLGPAPSERFSGWAIVELLGHRKLAGYVTEQRIAGGALVRIDVPETQHQRRTWGGDPEGPVETRPGYSKLVVVGSIYCLTPTSEAVAKRAAQELERHNNPLPVVLPEERQLMAPLAARAHGAEVADVEINDGWPEGFSLDAEDEDFASTQPEVERLVPVPESEQKLTRFEAIALVRRAVAALHAESGEDDYPLAVVRAKVLELVGERGRATFSEALFPTVLVDAQQADAIGLETTLEGYCVRYLGVGDGAAR